MGIRVTCPNCNRELNVKSFLAGKRGVCPDCKAKFQIPAGSPHNIVLEVDGSDDITAMPRTAVPASQPVSNAMRPLPPVGVAPATTPSPQVFPAAPMAQATFAQPTAALPQAVPISPSTPLVATADPIAQAPHAAWHISTAAGQRHGPMAGETLRQWVAEGHVAADSLLWRDGWPQWQRADQVFADLFMPRMPYAPSAMAPVAAAPPVVYPATVAFPVGEAAPDEVFPSEPPRLTRARSYGRRSQSSRTAIMVILILAVLILAPLLGYVLVQQF